MKGIKDFFLKLIRDEEGATATEYAVMLALIVAVAIGTIVTLGEQVEEGFAGVATAIENAGS